MQSARVVDLIDEARKIGGDIIESLVGHRIDGLDLERFHEALGLGVIVWIAAAPHRSDETMFGEGLPVAPGRVLGRSATRDRHRWWRYSADAVQAGGRVRASIA